MKTLALSLYEMDGYVKSITGGRCIPNAAVDFL